MVEIEDEMSWLRFRLRRLHAIHRILNDPDGDKTLVEAALRELIGDAENRIEALEKRAAIVTDAD